MDISNAANNATIFHLSDSALTLGTSIGTGTLSLFAGAGTFAGNVGIGKTSPGANLEVKGNFKIERSSIAEASEITMEAGEFDIKAHSAYKMRFFTGGSERMRITSGGDIAVGVTSAIAGSNFSIKGAATAGQQLISLHNPATSGTVYFMAFGTEASYSERGYITYDQTNIAFTQASDIKLKKNIKDLQNGLDTILKIKPRVYDWKDGRKNNVVGFVAQEVEQIKPDWVKEKDGLKMLDSNLPNTIPYLIKAVQEQQGMIQELKKEIEILKSK